MNERQTTEWGLEARWVKLSEREPGRDEEVFARNIKDGMIATIKFFEDGPMRYIANGESFIWDDDEVNEIPEWEWLELRPKEKPESAVPLPDGIHEVTLPDGQSALISDSGGCYGPAVPLPDGRMLEVNELHDLSEMFRLQYELNKRIGADMVDIAALCDKQAITRLTQMLVTAIQQELAELVDCVPWKWWRIIKITTDKTRG